MRLAGCEMRAADVGRARIRFRGSPTSSRYFSARENDVRYLHRDSVRRANISADAIADVEPIEVHHLGPGGGEIADEFFARIIAGVDLCQSAQLRVRSKQQVDPAGRPLDLGPASATSFECFGC